jgi:CheY-like chemotaxis protein
VPLSSAVPVELPMRDDRRIDAGQLAGMAVLCIDNEPAVLDGMETLLASWGCAVLKAADVDEALAAIERSPLLPTGLLVDYHLDRGNGIDAIARLRERCGDIPAILITADRTVLVREQARALGIQMLHKPLKPAALRALLAQWRVLRVVAAE